MLFQCIQDCRRVPIFIAAVKGQIKNLILCIFGVKGIIFRQLLIGGIGNRRFSVLLKAQSPVPFRRQDRRRHCASGVHGLCQKTACKEGQDKQKKHPRQPFDFFKFVHVSDSGFSFIIYIKGRFKTCRIFSKMLTLPEKKKESAKNSAKSRFLSV